MSLELVEDWLEVIALEWRTVRSFASDGEDEEEEVAGEEETDRGGDEE